MIVHPEKQIGEARTVLSTEGIKYAGSKKELIPHILGLVSGTGARTVFDAFSGTTRVSQALARSGLCVLSNDLSAWSRTFAVCYLQNTRDDEYFQTIIDHLNALPGVDGWITENYGGDPNKGSSVQPDGLKRPWQKHNTRKLDAIRPEIDRLGLPDNEKCVLLTSLILALDGVDNTLGHFASYLRDWSSRSGKPMVMCVPSICRPPANHEVFQSDVMNIAGTVRADIAYLDPPYGSNNDMMPPSRVRYASYYHLWSTICLNDQPALFGKARRRTDSSDGLAGSVFEEFRRGPDGRFIAVAAIDDLVLRLKTPHVILSYNSGGRATAAELHDVLSRHGKLLEVLRIDHRRNVMAGMRWTNEWVNDTDKPNVEFLFLLQKC